MQTRRMQRVRELLKRELSEVIRREIPLDEAGLLTVNDVTVAGDLQTATVFVGVVGTPTQQQRALTTLERERKRIQAALGRSVVLKYTPVLQFVLDHSIERGNRVLRILDELDSPGPATPS